MRGGGYKEGDGDGDGDSERGTGAEGEDLGDWREGS